MNECANCGKVCPPPKTAFCTTTCRKAVRRRARRVGQSKRQRIYARDGGRCWICRRPVDFTSTGAGSRPSLDHVLRVRDGGVKKKCNLRLAHQGCNERRN